MEFREVPVVYGLVVFEGDEPNWEITKKYFPHHRGYTLGGCCVGASKTEKKYICSQCKVDYNVWKAKRREELNSQPYQITAQAIEDHRLEVVLTGKLASAFRVKKVERISGLSIHLDILDPDVFGTGMRLYADLYAKDGQQIESMARAWYNINEEEGTVYANIRDYAEPVSVKRIELVGDWMKK